MVSELESSDTDNQWPPSQPSEAEEFKGFGESSDGRGAGDNVPPEGATEPPSNPDQSKTSFQCDQCQLTFRKRDHFDRHRFTHTGVKEYRCPEEGCGKEYTNRTHLNRHIRSNHTEKPVQPVNVFRCKHATCGKAFGTEQNMRRHYEVKHVLGKSWSCGECGERFWRKLQLKQHSVKHTGSYPHKCDICEKGFINLKSLRNHRTTHALHRCDSCPAEFTRWTDLVAHRKLQHATLYRCDVCQAKFPSKKNLKAHAKVHNGDDDREVFQCPWEGCPKFYDYERNLMAHIRSKHEGTHKFVCPVDGCGRALATRQKLEHHRRMHESAARSVPRMKAPPARRKDCGVPKRSTACRLARVRLDPQLERVLIEQSPERRTVELELECASSSAVESASESEVEGSAKVGAILAAQVEKIQAQIQKLQEQSSGN
uniref:Putative transcription factor iiia n=1 Tax=Culex tarsalis TaxID=7177 RepID=A0A1Q3EZY3_CULTA